ncbi:MAG: hypothetical protein WD638_13920 [Nitriliruptoraceae bacterium]
MTPIEERLRVSLSERAADVEPTPHLWQEVDRRITRRRWLRASVYAVVGATAAIVAAMVVPGVVSDLTGPSGLEIMGEDDAPGTDDGDGAEDTEPEEDGANGPDPAPGEGALPLVTADGRDLVLLTGDGDRTVLATLEAEGESTFATVSVRPGSSVDDLQVVASTTAEGMVDLRFLHVVAGELVTSTVLEGAYAPAGDAGSPEVGLDVVWSPDGGSLAWFEPSETPGGVSLRTIGFSEDGPGTGDRATDNAAFTLPLEDLDGPVDAAAWVDRDPADDGTDPVAGAVATTTIVAVARDGSPAVLTAALDRQADGAWARGPEDPGLTARILAEDGGGEGQRVLAATAVAGELRALVLRGTTAALVIADAGASEPVATELPEEVAAALGREGATSSIELVAAGPRTLIVDRVEGTAWSVSSDGQVDEFAVDGAVAAVR